MKELNEHIEFIITRKISSTITDDEQTLLSSWLAESEANSSHFNALQKIYSNKPQKGNYPAINIDLEWTKFKNTVRYEENLNKASFGWLRVAASVALIAVAGYFIWNAQFKSNSIQVVAQNWGEIIILPDNSQITLNKGAKLTYPKEFSSTNRKVSLEGEAFFKITRNENKPFIVNLSQSRVEVLGTSFNIKGNINNNKTEVVVSTGKVSFTNTSNAATVILTKGEKGTLMKSSNMITKTINNDVNVMAWKTRKIVFNNMELDRVIKTINTLYDAQISFSTDIGVNCNVTVSFENQSLEAVLSVLELTLNLRYKKSGDVIEIIQTGC
ncbi:MAG: FecR domain-containing protein [Cyclobacteriaceae bacterium]|nr:FecR domain-containing protein [Cyclobacteriaceae bacterium]